MFFVDMLLFAQYVSVCTVISLRPRIPPPFNCTHNMVRVVRVSTEFNVTVKSFRLVLAILPYLTCWIKVKTM